eukprot:201098-Rhodomonas_salina.3
MWQDNIRDTKQQAIILQGASSPRQNPKTLRPCPILPTMSVPHRPLNTAENTCPPRTNPRPTRTVQVLADTGSRYA